MRRTLFVLLSILVVASMLVAACGGAAPAAPAAPAEEAAEAPAEEAAAEAPAEEAAAEEAPAEEAAAEEAPAAEAVPEATVAPTPTPYAVIEGRTQVRWFVGLGTGTDAPQQEVQHRVVEEFNASQDKIQLILEVVPYNAARDTLSTQIAAGAGPDIVGPVGVGGSNGFYGQWLDLAPYIESSGYDTTQFNDALIKFYQTEEGQVGLPFAVFPGGVYFQKEMFDEAGLNYPPAVYGDPYLWPDGTEEEWSFDVLTKVAKILTVDGNGNSVWVLDDAGKPVAGTDFDRDDIVQYGYTAQYQHPNSVGSFWGAASLAGEDGKTATIPENWKAAWRWWWEGVHGEEPFIPSAPTVQADTFGAGNAFNSGKVAMGITQMWYTCCVAAAGEAWDLAVLPTYNGVVNGRVDADTFRVWKGTKNPEAAFEVLTYLLGDASLDLLGIYGGMPARAEDTDAFFAAKAEQYPFVQNWDVMIQGLAYPDVPSAEAYMPQWNEAFARVDTFGNLLLTDPAIDFDAEIETLQTDLQAIFDKAQ